VYSYYQNEGGNEVWKPVPTDKVSSLDNPMFVTILSVSTPVGDEMSKEDLAAVKYKGPFYVDFDAAESPASTAAHVRTFLKSLEALGVFADQLEIYASGGKGFHVIIPEEIFMTKPGKAGMTFLPQTYKEMAFELAVPSLDLRVYTARKGRMFRMANVKRPNSLYKVRISPEELENLTEEMYTELCSEPRSDLDVMQNSPALAYGMLELFDRCRAKVLKSIASRKKTKPVKLPAELPSFDAMLRGEGIREGAGFHPIALQVAIIAHAKGMTEEQFLEAAKGLCENHASDGSRYNTPQKRRQELARMFDYTSDNPCYEYSAPAVKALLSHAAQDLSGLEVSASEVAEGIAEGRPEDGEFEHGGVTMTQQGVFAMSEFGPKKITAMAFNNVVELKSAATGDVSCIEADILVAGRSQGRHTLELDAFKSVNGINNLAMRQGQAFTGSDTQARGLYLRVIEKARRAKTVMYVVSREGLDILKLTHHEDPDLREPFMIWADGKSVITEPRIAAKDISFRFIGYPEPRGQFRTDLADAPNLVEWLDADAANKEALRVFLRNLLTCQRPMIIGRLLGWTVACHYRMLFHKAYSKFPILHIAGSAGMGKTEMVKLFSRLHYYKEEPKMLTPTTTVFAVGQNIAGSSSIPMILDEFKPSELSPQNYDRFKLMLRDAYNCREVERGGGNRDSDDYRALHKTNLSAPVCFIAEAAEDESALMERVVFTMMIKPPEIQMAKYKRAFDAAGNGHAMLGTVGKYMAAQIVKRYSLEQLKADFDPMWAKARKDLMMHEELPDDMSAEEIRRRGGAKDRTVYNYTVAKFGLGKFASLCKAIFGDEFADLFKQMDDSIYDSMVELQDNTIPEWLKVFNTMTDMSVLNEESPHFLKRGQDYEIINYDGKEALEIYARACYFKYRSYMGASRMKTLFHSEQSFVHAISAIPSSLGSNITQELNAPGGSHIFDLEELVRSGFRNFPDR
jgi:hypothetical protein